MIVFFAEIGEILAIFSGSLVPNGAVKDIQQKNTLVWVCSVELTDVAENTIWRVHFGLEVFQPNTAFTTGGSTPSCIVVATSGKSIWGYSRFSMWSGNIFLLYFRSLMLFYLITLIWTRTSEGLSWIVHDFDYTRSVLCLLAWLLIIQMHQNLPEESDNCLSLSNNCVVIKYGSIKFETLFFIICSYCRSNSELHPVFINCHTESKVSQNLQRSTGGPIYMASVWLVQIFQL